MTTSTSPIEHVEPASVRTGPRNRVPLLAHSVFLTVRGVRTLMRQPAYAAITLIQPVIWLLLFGQLFRSVIDIPGFSSTSGSYLEFITPGVI
ncbi:MAG: hypothetical protein DLM58_11570, partial [Pseudonocardiales bacterium]